MQVGGAFLYAEGPVGVPRCVFHVLLHPGRERVARR